MKKYIITTVFFLIFIFILGGCYKEPVDVEPDACFTADVTTIEARQRVTFTFCGTGQFIVLWGGDEGHVYNEPKNTGKIINLETMLLRYQYRDTGTYTATCIATSYGDFGNEKKEDIQEIIITVTPETE
jgi:PKD repeat protein